MRELEYRPKQSKDFRFRFHALRAGVFRIKDVLTEIEAIMGLNSGEGKEYIQDLMNDLQRDDTIPILDLTWGRGLQAYLGSCAQFQYLTKLFNAI